VAIYHLSVKVVSRARGRSVVAAAAYRAGEQLRDNRIGQTFDYTHKPGVEHREIMPPSGAPDWVQDRETLWNAVEAVERRKDAQLAREVEIALPVELGREEQVELLRDFTQRAFVDRGMVADLAVHRDNAENPHAHILLTTRSLTEDGFGPKQRDWNKTGELLRWRGLWEELANEHLARAGLDIRIDQRTLAAQGIDLTPGVKIGVSADRQQEADLPRDIAERVAEQREIAAENGRRIIEDPSIAVQAISHYQAMFTERDVANFLHSRTDGLEQFQTAYLKVLASPDLLTLGTDERGRKRFTTRDMVAVEGEMLERANRLAASTTHRVSAHHRSQVLADGGLSEEQREAFHHVTGPSDLVALVGVAGTGKSKMLDSARHAWEAAGYTTKAGALSGIAAENLENSSGIVTRTLAGWEYAWAQNRDELRKGDIFVVDEAGLVGTRQLARILEHAEKAGAKVVLVGDPEQLQSIEAGAAFRGIASQIGAAQLTEVRRQKYAWQKQATRQLASGRTDEALRAYQHDGRIHALQSRDQARAALLMEWRRAAREQPNQSRLILAYTRDDAYKLNLEARRLRQDAGELGAAEVIETDRGPREFAIGDRLYFMRNERGLAVKNGSLGTVEQIQNGVLQVRLDGDEARQVVVDSQQYPFLEHGYAATVHKAQGATVDRTFVLATTHFDRHTAYVALSRHREKADVYYGRDDFKPLWGSASEAENFRAVLSRARPKDLAHDYLGRMGDGSVADVVTDTQEVPEMSSAKHRTERRPERERTAVEAPDKEALIADVRKQAVEAWRAFRAVQRIKDEPTNAKGNAHTRRGLDKSPLRDRQRARDQDLER
jgi:Ti-type conjugative transfer relaxase TraA